MGRAARRVRRAYLRKQARDPRGRVAAVVAAVVAGGALF